MSKVISFVMIGTNDLEKSTSFYDKILAVLGLKKVTTTERYVGYSNSDDPEEVKFYITKPHDKKPASVGNGTMVALLANTNDQREINKARCRIRKRAQRLRDKENDVRRFFI